MSQQSLYSPTPLRLSQDKKKRPSSLRFSQELDELLKWEGLSAIERLSIDRFQDVDHFSDVSGSPIATRGSFEDENHDVARDEAVGDFSELSTMLASAKKKLELLEGNLRGARDSLLVPSLPSPASVTSFHSTRPSTSNTAYDSSVSSIDDEPYFEAVRVQRISSAPLQYLHTNQTSSQHAGHARYNSDSTTAPTTIRPIRSMLTSSPIRSPKSPRGHAHKSSMDLLREKAAVLGPVTEDEVRNTWSQRMHTRQASSQASIASTQELRTQVAGVRRSLQKIKRRSLDLSKLADSSRVSLEVDELEKTLSRQERDIVLLEQATPRTSGRFVHARNTSGGKDQEDYYADEGYLDEYEDAKDESDVDGANVNANQSIEAFDYEVFILNNALGCYNDQNLSHDFLEHDSAGSEYQDAAERPSEDYSGRSSYESEALLRSSMWPQPPKAGNEAKVVIDESRNTYSTALSTPSSDVAVDSSAADGQDSAEGRITTQSSHSSMPSTSSILELGKDQDATSVILSALLPPAANEASPPSLSRADQLLLFSLATALRDACVALGTGSDDRRQRLVAATKVLRGET